MSTILAAGAEPALGQIHQQEGEVVEHVARGDQRAELDGVEQHRSPLKQHDVAEMEVAVDAADQPAPPALGQQRMDAPIGGAAHARERIDLGRRKQLGRLAEGGNVLLDIVGDRLDPGLRRDRCRAAVGRRHRAAERVRQRRIDLAVVGQAVERRVLGETAHLDRPLDRRAAAVERQPPVWRARDRHDAAIDVRRERPVDLDLGLAGRLALVEARIVEEREAHRALDLERTRAGKEHGRRVGIDALDLRPAMGRGVGEQRKHRLLGLEGVVHPFW